MRVAPAEGRMHRASDECTTRVQRGESRYRRREAMDRRCCSARVAHTRTHACSTPCAVHCALFECAPYRRTGIVAIGMPSSRRALTARGRAHSSIECSTSHARKRYAQAGADAGKSAMCLVESIRVESGGRARRVRVSFCV
jgi:hypothetical protein